VYGKINSFVVPFMLIVHHAVAVRSSLLEFAH